MGDMTAPPSVAATSSDDLVPDISKVSPTSSEKTVTPPPPSSIAVVEPQLGHGSAMFSTDLGRRAPRRLQGPPYVPVIARSDRVQGVLVAAGMWRHKHPQQYLSIFPQAGWQIGDLWDEEDIHLETESFCEELLRFIERDVYVRAKNLAEEWSRMYPERLQIVGGDITGLYDKNDHLSIVDKIFVHGEQQEYPPVFLWHVAHTMRAAMLETKGMKLPVKTAIVVPEHLNRGHEKPVVRGTAQVPATAEGTVTLPIAPSTRANSSTHVIIPSPPMPIPQPIPAYQGRPSPHIPANGMPNQGSRYTEPMGHTMVGVPAHQMGGLNLVHPGLRIPKIRSGRSGSGSYDQSMPSGHYVENTPYGSSGSYVRQPAGPVQSPRFNQAHMTVHYPMVNVSHGMVPFAYEQNTAAPGMIAGQPIHPGMVPPSMMPLHSMQSPSMMHGYTRQTSGHHGSSHAVPMGDMTNMHFSPSIVPHNIGPRHPGDRRYSQQHGNGSALYDPYEGNNPSFRAGKKSYHNGSQQHSIQNSNGRQRKASIPGSRPYHSQYMSDRSGNAQPSGQRFFGPKGFSEDDLAITQDYKHGCHIDWIGPQNTTVTEVFVKNLPEDVQDAELERLFQDSIGVKPKSINARSALQAQYNYSGRKHAFVGFSSAAVARQALRIRDPVIRGLPVSITVPKRFFQKIIEVPMQDATDAGPSSNSRFISHANSREARNRIPSTNGGSDITASVAVKKDNLSYSPQDARSDLHKKKKKGKQPQQGSAAAGSPEAQKAKPKKRQESPTKKKLVELTPVAQNSTKDEVTKAGDEEPTKGTIPVVRAQIEQPQTERDSSLESEQEISPTGAADGYTILGKYALSASKHGPTSPKSQQQHAAPQVESDPQPETQKTNTHVNYAKKGLTKASTKDKETRVTPDPLEEGDVASDDELKNNARSYSAADLQTDLEQKVEPCSNSDVANQGTTAPSPKTANYSTIGNILPTPHTASESNTASSAPENDTMAVSTGNDPSNSESTEPTMPLADSKAAQASVAVQQEAAPSPVSLSNAGTAKKNGSQHTESLHPFSKVSKAQAKKEKEQKRKAQKKEKEQAEKAKSAKAAAIKPTAKSALIEKGEPSKEKETAKTSGTTDEVDVTADSESAKNNTTSFADEDSSATTQKAPGSDSPAKKPAPIAKTTKGAVDGRDKPGKRKDKKADTAVISAADVEESKNDAYGKQSSGTISIPNEFGSMTKKEVKFNLPGDDLASGAQSFDQESTKEASNIAQELSSTATTGVGLSKSAKKRKKKKLRKVWPSLEFRPRSPNPAWMGPIDMENDPHDYDSIMNEACGGEDDSDFSWDDLPRQASSEDDNSSSVSDEDGDGDQGREEAKNEILKRIADLETQQAAMVYEKGTAAGSGQQKQALGEALFPKIEKLQPKFVGKITHMLLELDESELVKLISDESALRAKVDEAMSIHDKHFKNKDEKSEQKAPIKPKTLESDVCVEKEVILQDCAVPEAGMAMIKEEPSQFTDSRGLSETVATGPQPAKKKRNNKHKKRKKQQQLDAVAGTATDTATDTANAVEPTEIENPISDKASKDPIDTDDPFYNQLRGIDAIKRGDTGAADEQDSRSQHHAEVAKSLKDPEFMRTMEGYLKETQGTSQSKGRKVSKEDLL
ncbi:hypothetical protein M3J09_004343 [Ascochyta lentis]